MRKIALLNIIALVLLVVACSSTDDNVQVDTSNLIGNWELDGFLYQEDIIIPIPKLVSLNFSKTEEKTTLNGQSTCNGYGGQIASIGEKNISITEFYFTEIACTNQTLNTFESTYFNVLSSVKKYLIDSNTLILSYEDSYLTFKRTPK